MTALYACLASFVVPFAWGLWHWIRATKSESARALAVGALTEVERQRDAFKAGEQVQRERATRLEAATNTVLAENTVLRARVVDRLRPEEVLPALNDAFARGVK